MSDEQQQAPAFGPDPAGTWAPHMAVPELAAPAGGPHLAPGPALPRPEVADPGRGATRWGAPSGDYATAPDGTSGWMLPAPVPAGLPPAVEPVALRAGWLTAGRSEPDPESAG